MPLDNEKYSQKFLIQTNPGDIFRYKGKFYRRMQYACLEVGKGAEERRFIDRNVLYIEEENKLAIVAVLKIKK